MNPEQQPPAEPEPSSPVQLLRPQNSLLRRGDSSAAKRRPGEPEIYLSWGGEVYGPAAPEDVRAGIKVAYYEAGTTFWHEGMAEWRPLKEFPETFAAPTRPAPRPGPSPTTEANEPQGKSRGRAKKTKPPQPRKQSRHGLWVVIIFCLLAVGLTVGVILLMMLI